MSKISSYYQRRDLPGDSLHCPLPTGRAPRILVRIRLHQAGAPARKDYENGVAQPALLDARGSEKAKTARRATWMIEAGPPGALIRRGWRKDSVKPGVEVLVEGYRAIDGSTRANGRDVTLPDGTRLFRRFRRARAPPYDDPKSPERRK